LVGRDTKMHDLTILFSTLGGLIVFGPVGFIVGPILAGLFVTLWEMFGKAFDDVITPVGELGDTPAAGLPMPTTEARPSIPTPPVAPHGSPSDTSERSPGASAPVTSDSGH